MVPEAAWENAAILSWITSSILFSTFAADDLSDVPQMGHGPFGFRLFFFAVILQINGVGTAIAAFHLNAPAAIVGDDSSAPADGAFL